MFNNKNTLHKVTLRPGQMMIIILMMFKSTDDGIAAHIYTDYYHVNVDVI